MTSMCNQSAHGTTENSSGGRSWQLSRKPMSRVPTTLRPPGRLNRMCIELMLYAYCNWQLGITHWSHLIGDVLSERTAELQTPSKRFQASAKRYCHRRDVVVHIHMWHNRYSQRHNAPGAAYIRMIQCVINLNDHYTTSMCLLISY